MYGRRGETDICGEKCRLRKGCFLGKKKEGRCRWWQQEAALTGILPGYICLHTSFCRFPAQSAVTSLCPAKLATDDCMVERTLHTHPACGWLSVPADKHCPPLLVTPTE